jgi:hypothetical protein
MAKKKKAALETLEIKGDLVFSHQDPHMSRYHIEEAGEEPMIRGLGPLTIDPSFLGKDFDPTQEYTKGTFLLVLEKGKK